MKATIKLGTSILVEVELPGAADLATLIRELARQSAVPAAAVTPEPKPVTPGTADTKRGPGRPVGSQSKQPVLGTRTVRETINDALFTHPMSSSELLEAFTTRRPNTPRTTVYAALYALHKESLISKDNQDRWALVTPTLTTESSEAHA